MILTAHQPAYLPWLGYFDKINRSDLYIFLDSVQYETRSYINRNKIKTPNGEMWLSIPVKSKGHRDIPLLEVEIDSAVDWKKSHLKSMFLNYKKAPRFEECFPQLEKLYEPDFQFLSELCLHQLHFWFRQLGIQTPIVRLSDLQMESKKSDLIFDLCVKFGATDYISGALGKDYLEEQKFEGREIKIEYQNYVHPVYPQLWGEFLPYISIVDFWMNTTDNNKIWG
ncbi:WbqC family protein [Cohnella silvisoli]|uniref:WbqC family protein n=1 Tax=Cohnella silvisoli TaxID=2873699 RepID=A0ABV1KPK6_9BACL|nr:WbqC family protein [Cohnella silvisoli]MCD9022318.1 WbqC family protein [Cohnella silvisoli]